MQMLPACTRTSSNLMAKTLGTPIVGDEHSSKPSTRIARQRKSVRSLERTAALPVNSRRSLSLKGAPSAEGKYCLINLGDTRRLALLVTARGEGSFRQQAEDVLQVMQAMLAEDSELATITAQTVFLRDAGDQAECERLFTKHYGPRVPVTSFVVQPPCCGAALAVEAWAISGESVSVERHSSQLLAVEYDGMRWIYCGDVAARRLVAYEQATECFEELGRLLQQAGSRFESVIRTWLYVGGITDREAATSRYQEMNRARADFYRGTQFGRSLPIRNGIHSVYPASTGIGMCGSGMRMACMALETERQDIFLLPLENPQQISAYAYDPRYSLQSPKFSRGMALMAGDYLTSWISGTASIVSAETRHVGNLEAQTEQTIDNIERLIATENFARHHIPDAGATLHDLAKIRVYLKRAEDFARCREICERRFGPVPALYIVADICRPELLVEIEGVAFSKRSDSSVIGLR